MNPRDHAQIGLLVVFVVGLLGCRPEAPPASPEVAHPAPARVSPRPTADREERPPQVDRPPPPPFATREPKLERLHRALYELATEQRTSHVRVLWLGDSHAQADFWSGEVRDRLQARFGDGGPGFIHLGYRDYRHDHVELEIGGKWRMRPKRPATTKPEADGAFGLGGLTMGGYADGPRVRVSVQKPTTGRLTYDLCAKLRAPEDAIEVEVEGGDRLRIEAEPIGIAHHRLTGPAPGSLVLKYRGGSPDLCGLVVERDPTAEGAKPGVVLDTLGINGARYATALSWNAEAWTAEVARRAPSLVVLEYGGNEAGDAEPAYSKVGARVGELVSRIRAAAPEADCMVIAPTDRADAEDRVAPMRAAIAEGAARAGCFFFDAFTELGGTGSMAKMREESQPRAQKDGVHMTIRGYRAIGARTYEALVEGLDVPPPGEERATRSGS